MEWKKNWPFCSCCLLHYQNNIVGIIAPLQRTTTAKSRILNSLVTPPTYFWVCERASKSVPWNITVNDLWASMIWILKPIILYWLWQALNWYLNTIFILRFNVSIHKTFMKYVGRHLKLDYVTHFLMIAHAHAHYYKYGVLIWFLVVFSYLSIGRIHLPL